MSEVYEGSPIGVLSRTTGSGLPPGELGVVTGRAGVGKSAVLAHVALNELLRDRKVLHVAVYDSVESARAHYDTVIRAVARTQQSRDWTNALVSAERHRMIHSYLDRGFQVESVQSSLTMLREVMDFTPQMLAVDGLEETTENLRDLKRLAATLKVPIWVAFRTSRKGLEETAWEHISLSLRLTPEGRDVKLSTHTKNGEQGESELLDPSTMLIRGRRGEDGPKASLAASDCTLYSGGAKGTEAVFGAAAAQVGVHEVNFTFEGHRQERETGRYLLSPRELAAGDVSLVYVSRRLNRTYNAEGGVIRRVLQTLWHMVSRSQQVFVVGSIQEDGTVIGGTGWSVELARMWNKDLWVFDQDQEQWFQWSGEEWSAGEPLIHSVHFAGTGTRYLKESGQRAIEALMARSFS